jgi:hypothetical protein
VAVGDFNGDGRDDVARIGPAPGIVVYLSSNGGGFQPVSKPGLRSARRQSPTGPRC